MALSIGDRTRVKGYVTKEKLLKGKTVGEIERILGYHVGRLRSGATFLALVRTPIPGEFSLGGYSQVADHRATPPTGLDLDKIAQLAAASFATHGGGRLVKVFPSNAHNPAMGNDEQYPPGAGCPQWKLIREIEATVTAVVADYPNGRYQPVR